jgi:DNA-binding beta-propeller fold protein YncE
MRALICASAAALAAAAAYGDWVYEGKWGSQGSGNGLFNQPYAVSVEAKGNVYVADTRNYRIQYFNSSGSFLGKWGSQGSGNGQFRNPVGVGFNRSASRIYVSDYNNHRIQYFVDEEQIGVAPTPLGRVKALFR